MTTKGAAVPKLVVLAVLLALAVAAVVAGVASWSVGAAWVTGGVLGAVWACAFFLEVPPRAGDRG